MAEFSSLFSFHTKSLPRGRMLFLAPGSLTKQVVTFCVVLTVLGGHMSAVDAGPNSRTGHHQSPKPDHSVSCGPYTVCDLASHFCDTVMNTCVRCSDDCHPGRISGDSMAEEDCKRKCKVYYELKEERDRLIAKATTEQQSIVNQQQSIVNQQQSIVNQHHRADEKYLQLSVRSLNLINTDDNLTLARVELLMVIETIAIAVITVLLFIISICLIILIHRQRVKMVYSYSPLDTGRKTTSG